MKTVLGLAIAVWLIVGLVAATQRGYFGNDRSVNCKNAGDTALTVVAGPLNYVGVNPKISCHAPKAPQPSK